MQSKKETVKENGMMKGLDQHIQDPTHFPNNP